MEKEEFMRALNLTLLTDLYELIGAKTDKSPIFKAAISAIVPIVHNNPAKTT